MFYTAYEMFEGHRKRKWAWFPVSPWTLWQLLPLLLCFHACTLQHLHLWSRRASVPFGFRLLGLLGSTACMLPLPDNSC